MGRGVEFKELSSGKREGEGHQSEEEGVGWGKFSAGKSDHPPSGHRWPMAALGWSGLTSRPLAAPMRGQEVDGLDQWDRGMLPTTDQCWPMAGWGIWWRVGEPTPSQHCKSGFLLKEPSGMKDKNLLLKKKQIKIWFNYICHSCPKNTKMAFCKCSHNWCFCELSSPGSLISVLNGEYIRRKKVHLGIGKFMVVGPPLKDHL